MPTFTALTTLEGKAQAEALGLALEALDPKPIGVGVFEVEDGSGLWEVGGYFVESPDGIALALLAKAHGARDFSVSELPEVDWVAHVKRELKPVEAGRFFVHGAHDADRVPADAVALRIEAAMAFGTGHHGTTLGCLRALDRMVSAGVVKRRVADIGCGTAVLAMAAARVWPDTVLASDIDEVAPLVALSPDMGARIAPGGQAILSGILNPQADEVVAAYETAGFELSHRDEIGEWTTLTMTRL